MSRITVCIAPRLVKAELYEVFKENQKERFPSDFIVMYKKAERQDDSGETIYTIWVFQQIAWYPIRWEENLKDILWFIKKHKLKRKPNNIQFLDLDNWEVN